MEKLTPEQRDQLYLKKLTTELSLDANQQQEMAKIIADRSAKRETMITARKAQKEKGVKRTADERFKLKTEKLDYQSDEKEKIKKMLNAEQFAKYEKLKEAHKFKMKNKGKRKSDKTSNSDH